MRELEIAESIARDLAVERRARLDARIDEIARERDVTRSVFPRKLVVERYHGRSNS